MNIRSLTDFEMLELQALNEAVAEAIAARRAWLDAKMVECSELKVGDDIYELNSGRRLGIVSGLYRYWRDRDEGIRDTSHFCDYEFETEPRCFDNTSRHGSLVSFGTLEDAIQRNELKSRMLKRS